MQPAELEIETVDGFAFPRRAEDRKAAAERPWERLFALLVRNLQRCKGSSVMEPDRHSDQRLLDGIQDFVADHADPGVRRFADAIAAWGRDWSGVTPAWLPAADWLSEALAGTTPETHGLAALFEQETAARKWEQSYSKADGVVGEDMLAGYGFAEVIGERGPFISKRVRAGIGVWGPRIDYPSHRHEAEEVYVLLGGSAAFNLGRDDDLSRKTQGAGDVVYVPSMLTHGFCTGDQPLALLYIWQAGDLREKSTFC